MMSPGLYLGPGVYPGPGYYPGIYGKPLTAIIGPTGGPVEMSMKLKKT